MSFALPDFTERPYMVFWEVTRVCGLTCKHCRAEAQIRPHPNELTTSEAKKLIDQIAQVKPKLLILTGGDPMRRRDIVELIQYTAGKDFRLALSPSATPWLLATDFVKLKEWGVDGISLSLDGPDEASHNAFRGVSKTWEWTMTAISRAKEAGIGLQINTTMTRGNVERVHEFRQIMDSIQPQTWSIFMLIPTGRGRREDSLNPEEVENLFNQLFEISQDVSYMIKTTEGPHYRRLFLQRSGMKAEESPILGLNDGRGCVFISHTGEICPSGFLPIVTGNVRQDEWGEVYRQHKVFLELRDSTRLKGKCGRCEFNQICGGSRARAYALTGDYMAGETLCTYRPKALLSNPVNAAA